MPLMWAAFNVTCFAAHYFDGKTAVRHPVTVHLDARALRVLGKDDKVLDVWLFEAIELSDQANGGLRVVKKGSEARLVFSDPKAFATLQNCAPNLLSQKQRTLRNMGLSVVVTVVLVVGFYVSVPVLAGGVVKMIPFSTEQKLGDGYAKTITTLLSKGKDRKGCSQPAGQKVLDDMVAYLSTYNVGPFPIRVKVLDNAMVNAIALPGGHIFIFRGLLDAAQSDAEVAGVIAHEMAHVNHRHGMHGMVQSFGFSFLADMMFGGNALGNVSNFLMVSSHTRTAEGEADVDAIALLQKAKISTLGFARFFERLKNKEKSSKSSLFSLPEMLSTHPQSDAREALVRSTPTLSPKGWTLKDADWKALKAICD